ncbi:MAG TPA: acetate uptake transporter [Magnetospirillum sp.]|nr:acetate uptake transporter [Magnetospirillum sp.]
MSQIASIKVEPITTPAAPKLGNPAAVGLAGFGLTTLLLQFHNLGWVGIGPVVYVGLIFGGLAQMIAGLQEQKCGNNFGYCAFTSYGCFWIALCGILLGNKFDVFKSNETDVGWFLVGWTLFSSILWVGSMRVHKAMFLTFTTLMIGFILLDMAHFGFDKQVFTTLAAIDLIGCALLAWYMMAHVILSDLFGRPILPVGKPLLQ